jgi:hypothetical protein
MYEYVLFLHAIRGRKNRFVTVEGEKGEKLLKVNL